LFSTLDSQGNRLKLGQYLGATRPVLLYIRMNDYVNGVNEESGHNHDNNTNNTFKEKEEYGENQTIRVYKYAGFIVSLIKKTYPW
jgi:hypothetical protein